MNYIYLLQIILCFNQVLHLKKMKGLIPGDEGSVVFEPWFVVCFFF